MSANAKRALGTAIVTAAVVAAIVLCIVLYLTNVPGSVAATATPVGSQLYLAAVPADGFLFAISELPAWLARAVATLRERAKTHARRRHRHYASNVMDLSPA